MIEPCPDPSRLLEAALEELRQSDVAPLEGHVARCSTCAATLESLRTLAEDLRAPMSTEPSDRVVASVMTRITALEAPPAVSSRRNILGHASRAWVVAAAAAVLLLVPTALWFGSRRGGEEQVSGTFATRGGAAASRLAAEVLLIRDGRIVPVSGQSMGRSDALAVRVTNLSGRTMHLMAFGRDAAGAVHWLYPGYHDPRTNPPSVAIADGVKERLLDEVVQPEEPAAGPLRLVTVVSVEPLTVKDVEARLARGGPAATLFPGATTREWTARWEDGR